MTMNRQHDKIISVYIQGAYSQAMLSIPVLFDSFCIFTVPLVLFIVFPGQANGDHKYFTNNNSNTMRKTTTSQQIKKP